MVDQQTSDFFLTGKSRRVLPTSERQPAGKKRHRGNGSAFHAGALRKMRDPLINENAMRRVCAGGEKVGKGKNSQVVTGLQIGNPCSSSLPELLYPRPAHGFGGDCGCDSAPGDVSLIFTIM